MIIGEYWPLLDPAVDGQTVQGEPAFILKMLGWAPVTLHKTNGNGIIGSFFFSFLILCVLFK